MTEAAQCPARLPAPRGALCPAGPNGVVWTHQFLRGNKALWSVRAVGGGGTGDLRGGPSACWRPRGPDEVIRPPGIGARFCAPAPASRSCGTRGCAPTRAVPAVPAVVPRAVHPFKYRPRGHVPCRGPVPARRCRRGQGDLAARPGRCAALDARLWQLWQPSPHPARRTDRPYSLAPPYVLVCFPRVRCRGFWHHSSILLTLMPLRTPVHFAPA